MLSRPIVRSLAAVVAMAVLSPGSAFAACGCDKRPPKQATVRPRFASPEWPIILFHPSLVPGREYDVAFIRKIGSSTREKVVKATALLKRDQADFPFEELDVPEDRRTPIEPKPQLRVYVPRIGGPGPRGIRVTDRTTGQVNFQLPDSEFLLIGDPVDVRPEGTMVRSYLTAVDPDGYVYIALDLHKVLDPTIIEGLAHNESNRRLLPEHVVGYNAQGYMFSTLKDLPDDKKLFGWEIVPSDGKNSDMIRYWRHSFREWVDVHDEHKWGPKRLAPDDRYYWHTDGTPHVDNNLWVVAIKEDFFKIRKVRRAGSARRVLILRITTRPGENFAARR